jgi:putative addiction module antidote
MTDKPKGMSVEEAQTSFAAKAPKLRKTLKVRRIGNSLGVVLPKEMLVQLRVGEGDELSVSVTPDGIVLSPYDGDVERQMAAARDLMHRYRNALRELAK